MLYFAQIFIKDHFTFDNCFYLLSPYKTKVYWQTNNIKMEKNEFQQVRLKNLSCHYFDDILIEKKNKNKVLHTLPAVLLLLIQKLQKLKMKCLILAVYLKN